MTRWIGMLLVALLWVLPTTVEADDGRRELIDSRNRQSFTEGELARLEAAKVVFLLRDRDLKQKEEYLTALKRAWTMTEIEVGAFDDYPDFGSMPDHAFFVIEGAEAILMTARRAARSIGTPGSGSRSIWRRRRGSKAPSRSASAGWSSARTGRPMS